LSQLWSEAAGRRGKSVEWKIWMYKGDTHKKTHKNAERDIIGKEFADEDREEDDQYLKEK
jgi:hypothetical protein